MAATNDIDGRKYLSDFEQFAIEGDVTDIAPFGDGHIAQTFYVQTTVRNYVMQRMNTYVFPDVEGLMANFSAVTAHLEKKGEETIHLVPTREGKIFLRSPNGCFRVYHFIENAVGYSKVTSGELFCRAGEAFGRFQKALADFDASCLTEVIPHFHDTPKRFGDFCAALEKDACGRAAACPEEIAFFLDRKDSYARATDALADGRLPLRVTHNDTKLNNVLMDADTGLARAVIDLDTVMPGSLIFDFGDSIRFGASTAAEDEKDLSKVHFDLDLFDAYARGFCGALKDDITPFEAELLPYGAYLMTAECGMRFLGDYLAGDVYFATAYAEHNLVRARTQIRLASEMEQRQEEMAAVIRRVLKDSE